MKNRVCAVCGEKEGRDATQYELVHMITPPRFIRQKDVSGKWTGKYICTRCKSRENSRERNRWKEKRWEKTCRLKVGLKSGSMKRPCGQIPPSVGAKVIFKKEFLALEPVDAIIKPGDKGKIIWSASEWVTVKTDDDKYWVGPIKDLNE